MNRERMKGRLSFSAAQWGCYLAIAVIIGAMYAYTAPTLSDDVLYRFVWQDTWDEPLQQIASLADVFQSQYTHYLVTNGRSVVHTLAQIFMNLTPEWVMKSLHVVMFLLLIFLTTRWLTDDRKKEPVMALTTFAFLLLVFKGFRTAVLWQIGAFGYVWTWVMTLAFLLLARRLKDRPFKKRHGMLIPVAFLCGWTHEAIALPLSVTFATYMVTHRKAWNRSALFPLFIAYMMGTALIISTPALWTRADADGISLVQRMFLGCINLLTNVRMSWLLLATWIFLYLKDKTRGRNWLYRQRYLLLAWVMAAGLTFVCGSTLERVAFHADFLALLLWMDMVQDSLLRWKKIVLPTLGILCLGIGGWGIWEIRYNDLIHQELCRQLKEPGRDIIRVKEARRNPVAERFVHPSVDFGFYSCYMAFDAEDVNLRAVAHLFDRERAVFLPEDIGTSALGMLPIAYDRHVEGIVFELGEDRPENVRQRLYPYRGDTYELDDFHWEVLTIGRERWVVWTLPPGNIRRRITNIRLL